MATSPNIMNIIMATNRMPLQTVKSHLVWNANNVKPRQTAAVAPTASKTYIIQSNLKLVRNSNVSQFNKNTDRIGWHASSQCAQHKCLGQCEQSQKDEIGWKASAYTFATCHCNQSDKQYNDSDPHQFRMGAQKSICAGMVYAKCNKQHSNAQLSLKWKPNSMNISI